MLQTICNTASELGLREYTNSNLNLSTMARKTAVNTWTTKDDSLLKELFEAGGKTYSQITRHLKKATGKNRTAGAIQNRLYRLRKQGFVTKTRIARKGYTTVRGSQVPVAMTGNVVIQHKMFTMTTTKNSITITVNS